MPAPSATTAKKVRLRGREVIAHTAPFGGGRYCCFVLLLDPRRGARNPKVFRQYGGSPREAEVLALAAAQRFLDRPRIS